MRPNKQEDGVEEEQAFLTTVPLDEDAAWSQQGGSSRVTQYLRLILEIVMAFIIGVLLVGLMYERTEVKISPVPKCMFRPPCTTVW